MKVKVVVTYEKTIDVDAEDYDLSYDEEGNLLDEDGDKVDEDHLLDLVKEFYVDDPVELFDARKVSGTRESLEVEVSK